MAHCNDLSDLSAEAIFAPFLEVISSQSTTGPITFIALSSINKFLDYRVVSKDSPGLQLAISHLAMAITHCRFEATDQAEDDAVLLKILSLMEEIVCGIGSDMLNDESLCEIIETCLSMACQMRRGDLLRRSAEMTMIKLTEAVFYRLSDLEPEVVIDAKSVENSDLQMSEPSKAAVDSLVPGTTHDTESSLSGDESSKSSAEIPIEPTVDSEIHEEPHSPKPFAPYGLASIREYLRVLISIIDISNLHQYTDATRIMALHLINVAFEVSGSDITRHESLLNLTTNTLLKYLLQLIRVENPYVLQKALRVFSTILHTTREQLKLHQEVFLTYILTCLSPINDIPREAGVDGIFYDGVPSIPRTVLNASPHPSTVSTPVGGKSAHLDSTSLPSFVTMRTPDSREMMVEAITSLTRIPSFFVDLFVNYDCDVDRADLCVDMVGFLCRNAYPDSATWSTSSVPPLCLEAILSYLISLAQRLPTEPEDHELAEEAMRNKARKKLVIEATECFNDNPTKGLAFLVKHNLIPDDTTSSAVKFLRHSGRINKKLLGEFLAKPKNKEFMDLFIEDFDFSNKSLDEAMREIFAAFRLPGEAQQIERIIEKFAEHYVAGENNIKHVADKDSAFVLSYAVIILNTDLHNPQVKRHMTNEEFKRNLRKTNAGEDFEPEYLDNIYYTIKQREIIIPEEHNNDESFEHSWKEVLLKSQQAGKFKICKTSIYDKDMFESTWQPVVTMLSYIFATATDDSVFSRVITGFDLVAKIAGHYQIPGVLDQVAMSLSKISTMAFGGLETPTSTVEMQLEKDKIIVSDLSVQFGLDFKAQLASVVLFRLAKANMMIIEDCWKDLVPIISNLYLYSLIRSEYSDKQAKLGVPLLPQAKPGHVVRQSKASKDTSLFSTLSSYIAGYADAIAEPTDEEIDATLSTVDCVNSCGVPEFLEGLLVLPSSKLLKVVEVVQNTLPNLTGKAPAVRQRFYAGTLFLLDLVTLLAIESKDSTVMRAVIGLLRNSLSEWEVEEKNFLTRIIIYYLTLLQYAPSELASELDQALETISEIKDVVLLPCMPPLVAPLTKLADRSSWSSDQVLKQDKFWMLLRMAASNRESTGSVFTFVNGLVTNEDQVGLWNLVNVLDVLGEITSVGACGAQLEQDKAAIAIELRKQYDQSTAIKKAKELIAAMEGDVERAITALDLIYKLDSVVEASDTANANWIDVWYPYVRTLSQQCINPCRTIRQHAFKYYQRVVLSPVVHNREEFDWIGVFGQALFPLIDALLNPEVYDTDPSGMSRTRLHAASLLCKVFLQYIVRTSNDDEGNEKENEQRLDLWIKVLDTLDRLISSTGSEVPAPGTPTLPTASSALAGGSNMADSKPTKSTGGLEESVVESVKNLLLVIKASESQSKTDASKARQDRFWSETWNRVDVTMPGLRQQLEEASSIPDHNGTDKS